MESTKDKLLTELQAYLAAWKKRRKKGACAAGEEMAIDSYCKRIHLLNKGKTWAVKRNYQP